ncbi:MAG: type II toxin-antitoxin system RelE/ParE family toxin [Methanobacteriota archaeon]|nr:MAG: type II toxin-antitoxin system RelE/ParE family toxin [Euryarchaeota archaeon]
MSFQVNIKRKALKFVSKLDKKEKQRLEKALLLLKEDPVPVKSLDVTKIKGEKNTYRIRAGRIRVLYEVKWSEKIILIKRVDLRKSVYKK